MNRYSLLTGDVIEQLRTLTDKSVQSVVTSPPYWNQRDYRVDGQIGLEPTPEAFVEKIVEVFSEVKRVLRSDGTLWLNLGDKYSGSGMGRNGDGYVGKLSDKQASNVGSGFARHNNPAVEGIDGKNLLGIPWRVALALQQDGWLLRSDIIWHKPNAMCESVKDRPTKSHEYVFLLTKSAKYYYDAEAIKEPIVCERRAYSEPHIERRKSSDETSVKHASQIAYYERLRAQLNNGIRPGRNSRSVWSISTQGYHEAHFATFPEELPRRCIAAGSKEGDTILDPFSGAATTGYVALRMGRRYIGIELNPKYQAMAQRRLDKVGALV